MESWRIVDGVCPDFPPNSMLILLYVELVPKEPHFIKLELEYENFNLIVNNARCQLLKIAFNDRTLTIENTRIHPKLIFSDL